MNYNLETLTKQLINSDHGWSVADQFELSFKSRDFESQNVNALTYIGQTVTSLLKSNLLNKDAENELLHYAIDLKNYLSNYLD
jgi:hypothetical protein